MDLICQLELAMQSCTSCTKSRVPAPAMKPSITSIRADTSAPADTWRRLGFLNMLSTPVKPVRHKRHQHCNLDGVQDEQWTTTQDENLAGVAT